MARCCDFPSAGGKLLREPLHRTHGNNRHREPDVCRCYFQPDGESTREPVTITADDLTMTNGDDVPTLTYKSEGGDLKGTPKLSTTATKTSPVGTYPITVEQGTVTNEQVTYVAGTLTITVPVGVGQVLADEQQEPIFDLQGRRVDATILRKGLYIRGGKVIILGK